MISKIFKKVIGTKHDRDIKKLGSFVMRVNDLEPAMQELSNEALQAKTDEFRKRVADGETLDDILPEAFAVIREVSVRVMGMRHYDVQLIGGIVLHQGKNAEMKTGEGKTLTSTLACYLNAIGGKGVHMVTVNDYLAARDANWMRPIYSFLGITVGIIQNQMPHKERQAAYNCDITYGTNNEFGFDYLRDNMVSDPTHRVQRGHNFAIVDEVDSILIDEARTPLIISGPTDENNEQYYTVNKIMPALKGRVKLEDPIADKAEQEKLDMTRIHYELDEKSKNVFLTEAGVGEVERLLHVDNMYAPQNVDLVHHVHQALKATKAFHRDVDYVVEGGEVVIVDESTGRKMVGRRYSDGLHQALEAKEGVRIENENQTLATITFQNFFRMYNKLSGMTGTAVTEAEEFMKIYGLDVVAIPTNLPIAREDHPDRVYRTEPEKFMAIVEDIRERHLTDQPVSLVGTVTIEKSEELSTLLKQAKIPHNVLNAKFHLKEAEIVANAGKPKGVTIATNMAGRGTDIVLGGAPEYIADLDDLEEANNEAEDKQEAIAKFINLIRRKDFDGAKNSITSIRGDNWQKMAKNVLDRGLIWLADHNRVKEAGGLYVLGSERHESRRIDNQLRGRSGRQGDPGMTRFYLSFDDPLMRIFGSDRISGLMERLGMTDGQELEHPMVTRAIERAQKRVESYNFDHRKYLLEYDDVMNKQRDYIYTERNELLDGVDIAGKIKEFFEMELERLVEYDCQGTTPADWDYQSFTDEFQEIYNTKFDIPAETFDKGGKSQVELYKSALEIITKAYKAKAESIPAEDWAYLERMVVLEVIDGRWKEHLNAMDQLREGIWSVRYSEKQPLLEYKLQGFRLFDELKDRIFSEVCRFVMHVTPVKVEKEEEEYIEVGDAQHSEVGQFGAVGRSEEMIGQVSQGSSKNRKKSEAKSSGGASTRVKKRSRRRR